MQRGNRARATHVSAPPGSRPRPAAARPRRPAARPRRPAPPPPPRRTRPRPLPHRCSHRCRRCCSRPAPGPRPPRCVLEPPWTLGSPRGAIHPLRPGGEGYAASSPPHPPPHRQRPLQPPRSLRVPCQGVGPHPPTPAHPLRPRRHHCPHRLQAGQKLLPCDHYRPDPHGDSHAVDASARSQRGRGRAVSAARSAGSGQSPGTGSPRAWPRGAAPAASPAARRGRGGRRT